MSNRPQGRVRVVSFVGKPFDDRIQAAQLLARHLGDLRGRRPVVLGIPRGGVVLARELAHALDGELDVVLSRKLATPGRSELAMGALAEDGTVFLNEDIVRALGISQGMIEQEIERQSAEIRRRSQLVRRVYPRVALQDRVVVICDDGVATGATIQVALWAVRKENPQRLIAATPVASEEALQRLSADADEVVCLLQPSEFYAVGQWYRDFPQVDDTEFMRLLEGESSRRK